MQMAIKTRGGSGAVFYFFFSPPITPCFCFLLFPLSQAVGLHHGAGAKDETKHDSAWQPLSGSALIRGNPAVSGGAGGKKETRGGVKRNRDRGTQKK